MSSSFFFPTCFLPLLCFFLKKNHFFIKMKNCFSFSFLGFACCEMLFLFRAFSHNGCECLFDHWFWVGGVLFVQLNLIDVCHRFRCRLCLFCGLFKIFEYICLQFIIHDSLCVSGIYPLLLCSFPLSLSLLLFVILDQKS